MPEITVGAGGRIYKAMGHIAHKANQNAMINTLLCINAFNGTILWKRKLPEGFMVHRNTMVATADHLYMADDRSCKVIDGKSGEVVEEIVAPKELTDGPVWKWMAMRDGVLYALIGGEEAAVQTKKSNTPGLGHWPWGMWDGHDYKDPKKSFGFGRTFVAFDLKTKEVKWHYKDGDYLDSRGICMGEKDIFFYCPEKFLGALDHETGSPLWKNESADLLKAIGPNGRAQHYVTGYATTAYVKCNDDYLFFAGPQRSNLVAASTKDGSLVWDKRGGNLQLLLRDEALYVAGPKATSAKLEYDTGSLIENLPTRRACTRATGSIDSIFYRTNGGTVRYDVPSNSAQHIAPMRPPCQDGVIISDGHLFWGPWMCGCQLSLYGHIALAPAGSEGKKAADTPRLVRGEGKMDSIVELNVAEGDWPTYQANNARTSTSPVVFNSRDVERSWVFKPESESAPMPTAPVAAGGLVFVADRSGVVRALDSEGRVRWKACVSGAIYFPPAIWDGRAYVGSADGRVHAFEAATGRKLWSFRVAPAERWISIFGNIISTWPVAGGVVVENGTVYAAAGIAHYDGTHVVALDAITGELKSENNTSGSLSEEVDSGISVQGEISIVDGKLSFLAGGVYETAHYDLGSLKCLNEPKNSVGSQFRTAFYPYYPKYGRYVSLDHTYSDGSELSYDASYEGSRFTPLAKLVPLPPGAKKPHKLAARWGGQKLRDPKRKLFWKDGAGRRFTGFVVAPGTLIAAGHGNTPDPADSPKFLTAIDSKDGTPLWEKELTSLAVKGGIALDALGRIIVSLENGEIHCYSGRD